MSACSDSFLDIQPQDKPGSDNFLNNLSSAQELVVASFNPWVAQTQMYGKRFATICDALTDDGGLRLNGNDLIQVLDWNITPSLNYPTDWWKYSYQSVNAANYAIQEIPKLKNKGFTDSEINPYIAVARFMRAFNYMFLTTFYGDVPLITAPLSSFDEFSQPRTPVSEIYQKIIEDYILGREQMTNLFVLIDCRLEPQKIDLEFMEWLGENGVPFAIIFTKADKLSGGKAKDNVNKYLKKLSEQWEELPPYFLSSSEKKLGRKEILDYIESINQSVKG